MPKQKKKKQKKDSGPTTQAIARIRGLISEGRTYDEIAENYPTLRSSLEAAKMGALVALSAGQNGEPSAGAAGGNILTPPPVF